VQGHWVMGMASVGRNVTFGDDRPITVEIYLLDFKGDIYGQDLTIRWGHRMRGEIKFADAAGLVTQLQQDEQATRVYYDREPFHAQPRLWSALLAERED